MSISAAQLMVNISANPANAQAGIMSVASMLGKGGPLGLAALGAGAIIAGVGIASVKMAGDFQKGITSLATGAGESQKNLGLVSNGILQLAKDTGTSTSQLVSGMYMIESGGYHGAAGLAILKAAAEGAKVGNADLGVVADATDTILKNFGEHGALSASQAVNTLIATVANGKTHMEDLAGSLSQVLPTAAAAKIGLNSVMGAMATMTNEGVPAAEAATYLRQMMIALMAPSSGARNELAKIGITTDELAAKMHQGLPQALQLIQDHLKAAGIKEGSAQYVAALREIAGGSKQMQGLLDLGGQHLQTFSDLTAKVGKAGKTTGDQITGWNLVQGTFNQQMDRAKESVVTLFIQIGQKLLPVLTPLVKAFADNLPRAISGVTGAVKGFNNFLHDTGPGATAAKVALGILAGGLVGLGVAALVNAIPAIIASVAAFGAQAIAAGAAAVATLAAAAPFILIGMAIAGVVAIIILAVTHWKQITDALGNFWKMLQNLPGPVKLFGAILLGPIGLIILLVTHLSQVRDALGHFKDKLGEIAGAIGSWVGNLLGSIGHLRDEFVARVVKLAFDVTNKFLQLRQSVIDHIVKLKDNIIQKAKDLATGFLSPILGLPGKLLHLGEQLLQSFAQGLRNARGSVMSAVSNIPLIGGMAGAVNNMIPKFATGGIMHQSGLALVGERGPELVRLPAGAEVRPMDGNGRSGGALATLPASMQAIHITIQPQPVSVHMDGRKVAQVLVKHTPAAVRNSTGTRMF